MTAQKALAPCIPLALQRLLEGAGYAASISFERTDGRPATETDRCAVFALLAGYAVDAAPSPATRPRRHRKRPLD